MSVQDGQRVRQSVFNAAFLSRISDSDTIAKIDLKNTGSNFVTDLQKTINDILESISKLERSGVIDLIDGDVSKNILFSEPWIDSNYVVSIGIQCSDSNPIFLSHVITSKDANGFSISFNAPTDSSNYKLHYRIGRII